MDFFPKENAIPKILFPFHTWAAVQLTQEIQILSRLEAPKRPSKLYKYHVLLLQKRGGREEQRSTEEHRGAEFEFLFSLFLIYV
jgi:hypothetical protein